jgi:prepilin peptidase dependent protein B
MLIQNDLRQNGFTLIELMIALLISSIILVSLTSIYNSTIISSVKAHRTAQLSQQLQAAMELMAREIRRAGYWANAANDVSTGQNNNPFMAVGADISINADNNCILFSYDQNGNGAQSALNTANEDERYGFRLMNGAIQWRPSSAAFSCTAAANTWEDLTDTNIVTITNLVFTLTSRSVAVGASSEILVRSIDITLTGQLVDDTSITKTLNYTIKLQNDKYVP